MTVIIEIIIFVPFKIGNISKLTRPVFVDEVKYMILVYGIDIMPLNAIK